MYTNALGILVHKYVIRTSHPPTDVCSSPFVFLPYIDRDTYTTDTHRHRQAQAHTDTDRQTQTGIDRDRQMQTEMDRHTQTQRH